MNKKIIILTLVIFIISLQISFASDNSTDEVLSDPIGSLTIKVVWDDNNNADNIRPSSIHAGFEGYGDTLGSFDIKSSDGWQRTWNNLDSYQTTDQVSLVPNNVSGYDVKVSGSLSQGYTITYSLIKSETPKENTTNQTQDNFETQNTTSDSKPVSDNKTAEPVSKDTNNTTTVKKTIKTDKKPHKDTHNTGFPLLLGVLAVSLCGIVIGKKD